MPANPNLVLIGMPGSGKSTVGVVLAKRTRRGFIDADLVIQQAAGRTLQEIVDAGGSGALRDAEERAVLTIDVADQVIATGGSAVYSEAGMLHLRAGGRIVYLRVDVATLRQRLGDFSRRGIAMRPGQELEDLLAERGTAVPAIGRPGCRRGGPHNRGGLQTDRGGVGRLTGMGLAGRLTAALTPTAPSRSAAMACCTTTRQAHCLTTGALPTKSYERSRRGWSRPAPRYWPTLSCGPAGVEAPPEKQPLDAGFHCSQIGC